MNDVLTVILAGGKGSRLEPLTRDRAKPAVPFGGSYRIVDFTLSNCLNSGLKRILVLTQYKAMSLDRHINNGWREYFVSRMGEFIDVVPPQQRINERWYAGTADAVCQNIYVMERERPSDVLILSGDHIYKMNYREMVQAHRERGADLTIAALEVDVPSAREFGVMQVDPTNRIVGFEEKPDSPKTVPGKDDTCLASMGIYVFSTRFLFEQLLKDANNPGSNHDFGKDIIPSIIDTHEVYAYEFRDLNNKPEAYWRDVGTLDAYYEANMDLISVDPQLNVYDRQWPITTHQECLPPPKFVFGATDGEERVGTAIDSIVCPGTVISGGRVERCVVGNQVRINSYASVQDSILFEGVEVGRRARIRNAIIDKHVIIPPGTEIGYDEKADRARDFAISPNGVVVIGKSNVVEASMPAPRWMRGPMGKNIGRTVKR
ncbi:MAG: glucose-1-phosphate adenylyltransferase [Planctomycetota bacterium]